MHRSQLLQVLLVLQASCAAFLRSTVGSDARYNPVLQRRVKPPCASSVDYAAGFLASAVSTAAVYPVETYKVRLQARRPFVLGGKESPLTLLHGLELGLAKECPNAAIYLGAFEQLRSFALNQPALEGMQHDPRLVFMVALVCGALSDAAGSPLRLPFELVGKNVQSGQRTGSEPFLEVLDAALPPVGSERGPFLLQTWLAILARDMPFGALQLCAYELTKLAVAAYVDASAGTLLVEPDSFGMHMLEGGVAGAVTAILTTSAVPI